MGLLTFVIFHSCLSWRVVRSILSIAELAWTWWSQLWIIRSVWRTSWSVYVSLAMVSTVSSDLAFVWLLAAVSRTSWITHLLWMMSHRCHSVEWSMLLLLRSHLPTSRSWCSSNCSTALCTIKYLDRSISERAQHRLRVLLLSTMLLVFGARNLSTVVQILRGSTVSYHHALIVWKHVTMWNLSLVLGPMYHLWGSVQWLRLSFGTAMFVTSFATSWSWRLINLIILAMVLSWSCNSLTWRARDCVSSQCFGIDWTNMGMRWLLWCRTWSAWACVLVATLLLGCTIWSMIASRSHSTWATIVFAISSLGRFAFVVRTHPTLLAQAVIITAYLRCLFLNELLVITWRISSSVKLLLISQLLLLWWIMLLNILVLLWARLLSVWGLLSCTGRLLSWSITACSCSNWCSVVAWAALFLDELRSIGVLNHTLISLVHADIGWENTVIKMLLLCGIQRIWYLILWSNSWCWFTSLRLRDVLTR